MPKFKIFMISLFVLMILFCLKLSGHSIAGDCDDKRGSVGTSTVSGDHAYSAHWVCTEDPDLEYDTVNSSETVDRNESAALFVIGNNAPYTWSVSDTGFWFDAAHTQTTIVTSNNSTGVYADSAACGTAKITVTGCDDNTATGRVRCTVGTWISCGSALDYSSGLLDCTNTGITGCVSGDGLFRFTHNNEYGHLGTGCTGGSSCSGTIDCDGTTVSIASIASSGNCSGNYAGDQCFSYHNWSDQHIYFYYWGCP